MSPGNNSRHDVTRYVVRCSVLRQDSSPQYKKKKARRRRRKKKKNVACRG